MAEGDPLAIRFSFVEIGMPRQRFATLHLKAPTPLALGLNEKSTRSRIDTPKMWVNADSRTAKVDETFAVVC